MVLVIDTSSVIAAVALLDGDRVVGESTYASGRETELRERVRALCGDRRLDAVVVATGPGSFTGLRVGAAYAAGLALGLRVPLRGLGTLDIQAERARGAAPGVSEAGRGRVYVGGGGRSPALLEAGQVRDAEVAGWLRPATAAALGGRLLAESELDGFGAAAARLAGGALELDYARVSLDYMQSFGRLD